MDNKKWGKRFSTLFWWSLTILPLILALIYFIGYHLTFNSGISSAADLASYHSNSSGLFLEYLSKILEDTNFSFDMFGLPFIYDMFYDLFILLGISDEATILTSLFTWMASVQMYHLLFDFVAWLPRLIHSWMDRWCVE